MVEIKTSLYIRVSTTEQAKEGYSLAHQRRKLASYCDVKNWSIVEIYTDEGISGSSISERPAATQMLEDAKHGVFENILILKVDRLCRNTRDLLEIVDILKKYNVRLNAVDEQIDYTTPTGKLMLTMLGSFAELERSTITERMKSGRQQKVRTGIKSKTGKILFGYDYIDGQYKINEEHATIVRLMYEKVINGSSIRGIAKYLMDNKIKNSLGDVNWTASVVKRILLNPTYKGYTFISLYKSPNRYIDFDSALMEKATNVEPIISEDTFDQVFTMLKSRSNQKVRKFAKDDFYFADVAYCSACGWKLFARNAKNNQGPIRRKYYRCYRKNSTFQDVCEGFTSIENNVLEDLFLSYLENLEIKIDNAEDPENKPIIEEDKILLGNLISSRDRIKQRKEKLLEKLLDGLIPDDEYTSTSISLSSELEDLTWRINEIENASKKIVNVSNNYAELRNELKDQGLTIRMLWSILDDYQKRTLVTTLVKKINVARSKIVSIEFN